MLKRCGRGTWSHFTSIGPRRQSTSSEISVSNTKPAIVSTVLPELTSRTNSRPKMKPFTTALLAIVATLFVMTDAAVPTCPQFLTYDDTMYSICLSKDNYGYDGAWNYCHTISADMCTLVQLAELYRLGTRDDHWGRIATIGKERDARLSPCGDYKGRECYNNVADEPYFPNTPRPNWYEQVYCCKNAK
ncbi:uncharacterized protein LOC110985245 isoform X1 [Acanthaster planci]|uniref:Uncharacterized protein LOC110985245 isoform X1 n=1 Tax=Acanthaster planci TaxID=133434 RepID=A0A8B7Z845_ACAPL|nr:uncharacterized protein LOC110985245 isoform X1 [Acanthaster planci]